MQTENQGKLVLLCDAHRCEKVLYGHQHSFEQNLLRCDWSPDGSRVAAGSSDRIVYIWDAGELCLWLITQLTHTGLYSCYDAVLVGTQNKHVCQKTHAEAARLG
jgi:WD40 repeat protein